MNQEAGRLVAHLSKWFVVLGIGALIPAAMLVGGSVGEVLRHPSLGSAEVLRHESQVLALAVAATFLLSTAAGLRDGRRWALLMGMAVAGLLLALGAALLVGNAGLLSLFGMPRFLGLAAVMLGLGALLSGARLLRSLWSASTLALPFGRADLRAIGGLGLVVVAGAIGHVIAAGLVT